MSWIWEQENWPKFTWNSENLVKKATQTTYQLGILRGKISGGDDATLSEAQLEAFVSEVISTSEIEGEILERKSVRSSIARRLGLEDYGFKKFDRKAEGIIEILSDATKNYDQKLDLKRLFSWHAGLFPKGYSGISEINSGELRGEGPMRVISGQLTDSIKVHFEAPPQAKVETEMNRFIEWFNNEKIVNSMDGLIRAAIAKFWFVTIHPFDDGNGRISRAISDMALAQSEKNPKRIISLSSSFLEDISSYYEVLENSQRGSLDISAWIEWYINHLNKSISHTEIMIDSIVKKSKFWINFKEININDRQRKAINKMLDLYPQNFEGGMTNKKYSSITKSSSITAARDLSELCKNGLLIKGEGGGRSTHYLINIEGLNKDIK